MNNLMIEAKISDRYHIRKINYKHRDTYCIYMVCDKETGYCGAVSIIDGVEVVLCMLKDGKWWIIENGHSECRQDIGPYDNVEVALVDFIMRNERSTCGIK